MNKLGELEAFVEAGGPYAIAVSGGVDSMTLAVVAARLQTGTEVFHALSPAVPREATARVEAYARRENWDLRLVDAGEIHDPAYVANPANRCYFCKTNLYDTIADKTALTIASGTNLDDLGDYRPGLAAAAEHDVIHPYVETGISKAALRQIARSLQLTDLQDLPAAPCLSSRVTTGIAIDPRLLPVINEVEQKLWDLLPTLIEVRAVRCRIRPGGVAIEIESSDNLDAVRAPTASLVDELFAASGYGHLTTRISVEAYERGSAFLIETLSVG